MEHFILSSTVRSYPRFEYDRIKNDILGENYTLSLVFIGIARAKKLNKKINDYMIKNVSGYNAAQWCKIQTDNDGNYSVYIKSLDSRNPEKVLDNLTKAKIIDKCSRCVWITNFFNITEEDLK